METSRQLVVKRRVGKNQRLMPCVYREVNFRMAMGLMNIGRGPSHAAHLAAFLDMPVCRTSFPKAYKAAMKTIRPHYEQQARASCKRACLAIRRRNLKRRTTHRLKLIKNPYFTDDIRHRFRRLVGCEASADGGWPKRGSGNSYSSLSGVVAVRDNISKKIFAYSIKVVACRKCQRY